MDPESGKWLVSQSVRWTIAAGKAITSAGGIPKSILDKFPPDLMETLIRNDIHLCHSPVDEN